MPRVDAQLTQEELSTLRQRIRDAEYRLDGVNDLYRGQRSWEWRIGPELAERFRVWDESRGESHDSPFRYQEMFRPFPAYADTPLEQCHCYAYRPNPNGCINCRPDLFQECPCNRHYVIGESCSCWRTCTQCDTHAYMADPLFTHYGDAFCSMECVNDYGYGYARCSHSSWGDDCRYVTDHHSGLCRNHRPCDCGTCGECRTRARIHSYSYKPSPRFKGTGPLYLGLECEINTGNASLVDVAEFVNRELRNEDAGEIGYLKSDSSIDCGFEMVTHPMSYRWAMAEFPWHMFGVLTSEYGLDSSEECGIHVHASRDGFTGTRHLYMWQKFVYRNKRAFQQIARRGDESSWCRFSREGRNLAAYVAKTGGQYGREVPADAWYLPRGMRTHNPRYYPTIPGPSLDRYSAINVQNSATLEMRIFAGSVYATEVKAALGLVQASIEYTRALDAQSVLKKEGWAWGTFRNWVNDRNEFDALSTEIERLVTA